jgi:segregation and condensation protein A
MPDSGVVAEPAAKLQAGGAGAAVQPAGGTDREPPRTSSPFSVSLDNFEGPFDLLLALIAKHQLDVTEIALAQVTDDFIAHIRAAGADWDLGQATEFLVVAATLLDLKAARLLPGPAVEDEEDLALLEARDLLFARLLQYRAYKVAATYLERMLATEGLRHARAVTLEEAFANVLPEVHLGISAQQLAELAARALTPRSAPVVETDHVHSSTVSVREQTAILRERLRRTGGGSFRALTADCTERAEVVARFLGLLELYREGVIVFEQVEALGDLHVRWSGPSLTQSDTGVPDAGAEWDDEAAVLDADMESYVEGDRTS